MTEWTAEQRQVIGSRNHNLLVSAAAGSGKTAVLVERILKRILDEREPVDVDRLLVVTFTKAAAAQMRERIEAAIERARAEDPQNERLQKQQALLHHAQITTIDSFCLFVVRDHFDQIGLDPNFRIADPGEVRLLEQDVLHEVFEAYYEREDAAFTELVDAYSGNRSDRAVRDMVLSVARMSQSQPWPSAWIRGLAEAYRMPGGQGEDAPVFREAAAAAGVRIDGCRRELERLRALAEQEPGLEKYAQTLARDVELFTEPVTTGREADYGELYRFLHGLKLPAIAQIRGFEGDESRKSYIKDGRNAVKKELETIRKKLVPLSPEEVIAQTERLLPHIEALTEVTITFLEALDAEKRRKRIADFADIEHFALRILVEEETGMPRPAAEELRRQFAEIMIDEYQDSNQVQEAILTAIARRPPEYDLFMVGDVKQSIYRFRLARPELFMDKFDRYGTDESSPEQRIDLHRNFRSRSEVLDFTNDMFRKLMHKDLGNVTYDEQAALYPGAVYPENASARTEVLILDRSGGMAEPDEAGDTEVPAGKTEAHAAKAGVPAGRPEALDEGQRRLEARMVAQRIAELMRHGRVTDERTGALRPVQYRDIVILVRSLKGWDAELTEILGELGIPVHVESSTGYFSAIEVRTVLCFLQLLDNPYQDIPMAAVLKSPIVGLAEEELAQIAVSDRTVSFAEAALRCMREAKEGALHRFYLLYRSLRDAVSDTPIHVLIQRLLRESGYGNYAAAMPAGSRRAANLDMLVEKAVAYEQTSYKGLFHFVRYIEELKKYDVDFGEADTAGENEDVVRVLTIHKSKGLEFPVVFLCGTGRAFNRMDESQRLVLHADLGIGLHEMDKRPRIRHDTLIRNVITDRIRRENLGEELRVLYVALTRAKEKLILTGSTADWEKELGKHTGAQGEGPLPFHTRFSAGCYQDWLIPAMLSYGDRYEVQTVSPEELVWEAQKDRAIGVFTERELLERIEAVKPEQVEALAKDFAYVYPYREEVGRKSKYSVSELKHQSMLERYDAAQEALPRPDFLNGEEPYVPFFLREEGEVSEAASQKTAAGDAASLAKLSNVPPQCGVSKTEASASGADAVFTEGLVVSRGALRGTAVHRVMECLDFAAIAELDRKDAHAVRLFVQNETDRMLQRGLLTQEMKELIVPEAIEVFVRDDVAGRMAQAQLRDELYREKPFVMEHEGVLVQGIIDVFWREGNRLVLMDYKTDRVDTPQELLERYETQLLLYREALERIFSREGKPVTAEECLLYSFRLHGVVRL